MTQLNAQEEVIGSDYPLFSLNKSVNKFIDAKGILDDDLTIEKVRDYQITNTEFFEYLYQTYSTGESIQVFLKKVVGYNYQEPTYKSSVYQLMDSVVQRIRAQVMTEDEIDKRTIMAAKFANTKLTPQAKDIIKINLGNLTYYKIAELIYEKTQIEISTSGIAEYVSTNNLPNADDFNETKFQNVYDLYLLGVPDEQIGNLFNIKAKSVSLILKDRFGIIRKFPWGRDPEAIIKRVSELRQMNFQFGEIAKAIKTEFRIKAIVDKRSLISVGHRYRDAIPSEDDLASKREAELKSQIVQLIKTGTPRNEIKEKLGLSSGRTSRLMTELRQSGELDYSLFKWNTEVVIGEEKMTADSYLKEILLKDPIIASLSRREISSYVEGKLSSIGLDNPPSLEAIRIKVRRTLKTMRPEES